jgi:hypothetical protein
VIEAVLRADLKPKAPPAAAPAEKSTAAPAGVAA